MITKDYLEAKTKIADLKEQIKILEESTKDVEKALRENYGKTGVEIYDDKARIMIQVRKGAKRTKLRKLEDMPVHVQGFIEEHKEEMYEQVINRPAIYFMQDVTKPVSLVESGS